MTTSSVCLAILYTILSAAGLLTLFNASRRSKRLLWPMSLNLGVAAVILILAFVYPSKLLSINPFGIGHHELFVTLLLALVFAVFVEVPGFALNFSFDKKKESTLQTIADILLDVRFSPTDGNRQRLCDVAKRNRVILDDSNLGSFILKCADEFLKLGNSDSGILTILTEQVRREQLKVSDQSKHPFPVLIQVFSLSSVAFVLSEILAILRAR